MNADLTADILTQEVLSTLAVAPDMQGLLGGIELRNINAYVAKHPELMRLALQRTLDRTDQILAPKPKGTKAMATAPYISDPFPAIKIMIDSAATKADRIHAGFGVLDYGMITYGPLVGLRSSDAKPDLTEAELCDCIKAACDCDSKDGMKAIDWAKVWATVQPFALQLLQRLLFS